MRIALFGGSFDPPHRGHRAIARAAAEKFRLDRILFAPVAQQPLKQRLASASFADRLAMVDRLCQAESTYNFEAASIDGPRTDGQPNFTIDTLRKLRSDLSHQKDLQLFTILGADSFLDLRHWRSSDDLLAECDWIVISRPGFSLSNLSPLSLAQKQLAKVHLLEGVHERVSATEIRSRLAAKLDCTDLLTSEVLAYIQAQKLYQSPKP